MQLRYWLEAVYPLFTERSVIPQGIGVGRGAVSGAVCVSIPLMWEGLKFTTLALPMFFAPYDEGHAGPRDCSYVTVPVHVVAHCDGRYRWYLVPCP